MKSFIFRCGEECWIEHVSRDKNEELKMMNLVLELEDIFIYFIHISFSYMQCNATKWRVACSMGKVGSILRLMNCYHMATYDFLLPSVTSLPFFFIEEWDCLYYILSHFIVNLLSVFIFIMNLGLFS